MPLAIHLARPGLVAKQPLQCFFLRPITKNPRRIGFYQASDAPPSCSSAPLLHAPRSQQCAALLPSTFDDGRPRPCPLEVWASDLIADSAHPCHGTGTVHRLAVLLITHYLPIPAYLHLNRHHSLITPAAPVILSALCLPTRPTTSFPTANPTPSACTTLVHISEFRPLGQNVTSSVGTTPHDRCCAEEAQKHPCPHYNTSKSSHTRIPSSDILSYLCT